jgi:hypothetical protein
MDWRLALVTFRDRAADARGVVVFPAARSRLLPRDSDRGRAIERLPARERVGNAGRAAVRAARRATPRSSGRSTNAHRDAQLSGVFYESVFSALVELLASLTPRRHRVGRRRTPPARSGDRSARWSRSSSTPAGSSGRSRSCRSATPSCKRPWRRGAHLSAPRHRAVHRSPPDAHRLAGRARGAIAFENVTFAYVEGTPVLEDVSFAIRPASGSRSWVGPAPGSRH